MGCTAWAASHDTSTDRAEAAVRACAVTAGGRDHPLQHVLQERPLRALGGAAADLLVVVGDDQLRRARGLRGEDRADRGMAGAEVVQPRRRHQRAVVADQARGLGVREDQVVAEHRLGGDAGGGRDDLEERGARARVTTAAAGAPGR